MPAVRRATTSLLLALCLGAAVASGCSTSSKQANPPPAGAKLDAARGSGEPPDQPTDASDPAKRAELAKLQEETDPSRLEDLLTRGEADVSRGLTGGGVQKSGQPAPQQSGLSRDDGCSLACKALASMRRASDRLCALTGEGDSRCTRARERTRTAAASVKATCPTCAT